MTCTQAWTLNGSELKPNVPKISLIFSMKGFGKHKTALILYKIECWLHHIHALNTKMGDFFFSSFWARRNIIINVICVIYPNLNHQQQLHWKQSVRLACWSNTLQNINGICIQHWISNRNKTKANKINVWWIFYRFIFICIHIIDFHKNPNSTNKKNRRFSEKQSNTTNATQQSSNFFLWFAFSTDCKCHNQNKRVYAHFA